jgi:PD-(D/E)XK endonuclease
LDLTTDQRGVLAETAIVHAAVKLGIGVAKPVGDERYDLIFDLDGTLVRVQCKLARRRGDVVTIRCYSARRTPGGLLKRTYAAGEIDAFAAFCPELDRCYYVPYERVGDRTQVDLRLTPCRNNQRIGVNWAEDFEFGATLSRVPGAIAQLGERVHGMHEVAGSSPAGSTSEAV